MELKDLNYLKMKDKTETVIFFVSQIDYRGWPNFHSENKIDIIVFILCFSLSKKIELGNLIDWYT